MKKKSAILMYPVIFGFILALTIFYILSIQERVETETNYIGEIQIATLKIMQEAEKDLLYIDNAAKLAAQQTVYELAEKGGFKEPKCGEYGFNLWNNKTSECYPDYKNNFTSLFNEKLNNFLSRFNLINNYNFLINQNNKLQIIGLAINDLVLDIRIIAEKIRAIIEYIIPKNAEEIVKKIKEIYGNKILIEIAKNDIGESLVIAVIAQESKGNPRAISPTGCAGLMQFCYCTAYSYSDIDSPSCEKAGYKKTDDEIFNKLTSCDCTGEICKTDAKCDVDNDDRLDPGKSIEAGTKYLSKLLKKFEKYDAKEEFAIASYNAGETVIKKAVDKAGKNPSWQEVSVKITPDLITYFDSYKEKKNKIREIRNYVINVMGYKKQFEENSNLITGDVIKTLSQDGSLGKYSIKPNFKVNLDYNLDEYQNVIEDAKELVEKCKDDNNLKLCINQNKKFTQDCETEEEKVVNDFIELYEDCYKSNNDNCYCEMNFDYKDKYEFDIKLDEEKYYKINDKRFKINDVHFINYYKIDKDKFELKNKDDEIKGNTLVIYKEKTMTEPLEIIQLFLGKKENDNEIELFNKKINIKDENIGLCKLKQKRKFKFCYKTDKQVLTKEGMKEPIIRFALMFPDTTPPEPLEVQALNYPSDKYRIILTWNKIEDGEMYKIYYSEEDFKDEKISELEADFELNSEIEDEFKINDINLKKCEFFPSGKPCEFDKYNKKLESNKLYYIESGEYKDKYVYVFDLEGKYNFLVTAVDDSDNEIDEINDINYKTITSKNNLPFKRVSELEVKQDNADVKLSWKKPEGYLDGSSYKNEELKTYRIRLVEKFGPGSQLVPSKGAMKKGEYITTTEHTFINMELRDYTYSVFAVNNGGAEGIYLTYIPPPE